MEGLVMAGQLILGLSILVTLHEFGHFITAKWFKMRVEKFYLFFDFLFPIPTVLNFALFKKKVGDDDYGKFGFSEHYLNLMMHIAYEEGQKNATDRLTRDFESSTRDMKKTIGLIISALDDNDLLPDYDRDNY